MNLLSAINLQKSYSGRKVIKNVSIEVSQGQIVGLLGPNGAGKTTCFYMIVGLVKLDSGKVKINEHDVSVMPIHERARLGIGYLPQEASIFRGLTVEDNILAILETRPDLDEKKRLAELKKLLGEFRIEKIKNSIGQSLSGGERRRVEIARALASEPNFVLLDEPFAGVDPISVNDIKDTIRQLKSRGIGILITDHNVRDTLDICESAYIIGEGKVIAAGTPKEIISNSKVRDSYLGSDFSL
tara:strand:+ start:187 stop:912 length:726 start_codon:yes stop_codon:yes gene_type:complete